MCVVQLNHNLFRKFFSLFREARELHRVGIYQLKESESYYIKETDIGNFGEFNGSLVPLDFPMYSEDVDLSLSIMKNNFQVWYIPNSKIWHKVSASIGGSFSFSKNKRKLIGLLLLYRKHANLFQYISIIIFIPFQLLYQIIKLVFTRKK